MTSVTKGFGAPTPRNPRAVTPGCLQHSPPRRPSPIKPYSHKWSYHPHIFFAPPPPSKTKVIVYLLTTSLRYGLFFFKALYNLTKISWPQLKLPIDWHLRTFPALCSEENYYLLTYSMVQSPPWEANRFPASQEIPHIFTEPEGSLPHSQASATCPYPVPAQSSPHTHIPPPGDPS